MADLRVTLHIRPEREAQGLTQRVLAEKAGITRPYLQRAENGKGPMTLDKLLRVANALDVDPRQLASFPGWPTLACACRCPCHSQEVLHEL